MGAVNGDSRILLGYTSETTTANMGTQKSIVNTGGRENWVKTGIKTGKENLERYTNLPVKSDNY